MVNRFLDVPFAEKDIAKSLGAKWNNELRKWYVPAGLKIEPFVRWLPEESHDEGLVAIGNFYIAESVTICYRCQNSARVFCLASDGYELEGTAEWKCFVTYSNVQQIPSTLNNFLMRAVPTYCPDNSSTQGQALYMNHCDCGAKLGDFYLHSEPGGAFCPTSRGEAENITLHKIDFSSNRVPLSAHENWFDPDYIYLFAQRL